MKSIASKKNVRLGLNKRTVAALNFVEMAFIGGGIDSLAAAAIDETDIKSQEPTCITYDTTIETGITPAGGVETVELGTGQS